MPLTRTMADVCQMQFVSACVRVHMRTCTSRPKRLKLFGHHAHSMRLSSVPGFGLVDGFSALQPMLSFLRRCCRQQNSIKWRDGRLEWQQTHREAEVRWSWWWGEGGNTPLFASIPLGEGRGNFSSRSRRRCHGDTEILRRRAACAELGAARGEAHVSTCRQRDGSQQLSCPEIKSFFFIILFYL